MIALASGPESFGPRTTIVNALRVAADQYRADFEFLTKDGPSAEMGVRRVVAQFLVQENEARLLADRIEEGT